MKKRLINVLLVGIMAAFSYHWSEADIMPMGISVGAAAAEEVILESTAGVQPLAGEASAEIVTQPLSEEVEASAEDMAQDSAETEEAVPESEETESEYANLAIAQVDHYVNVRSEPNTDSAILGKIYNGAVAQILNTAGEENDWFHVISGSVEGYIKAEYFLYGDAAVEAVDQYVTRYATVIADRLNVRQEQSTEAKRIGYIDRGEKVKLLEELGDWLLVQYTEEKTGYVAAE
ncbi:MAG: SH3 domain-containing protein [Lachnospiraceae bacterium]|nr:SH3 domain-containing protein [Lachnospiraceae bacterium]